MKNIKPVMVHWRDSVGQSGWGAYEDASLDCVSVGILVKKTSNVIVLALNQSSYQQGDYMTIPRFAVQRIDYLAVKGAI